jgi:hypothetical protein
LRLGFFGDPDSLFGWSSRQYLEILCAGGERVGANNPTEEWRRLNALYSEMVDTELLELRTEFPDLTEMAQDVLRDELKKRQLWDLPLPAKDPLNESSDNDENEDDFFQDLRLGGVTVREYDTVNDAKLAGYVLDLAGIRAVTVQSNDSFDLRLPFVRVAPEDAEKAATILAQPISAKIRAEFEAMRNLPDFEAPACPRCSCSEALLEAFEPTNQWLCEECGHRWKDAAPETQE